MFSPEIRCNKILPSRINLTIYNRLYDSEIKGRRDVDCRKILCFWYNKKLAATMKKDGKTTGTSRSLFYTSKGTSTISKKGQTKLASFEVSFNFNNLVLIA